MAEIGEERSAEEVLKLRFEFFKHMTTVSTASTAAVIAVYGLSEKALRGAAEDWMGKDWDWLVSVTLAIPGFAIGGFFLSLLLCLWGLYLVAQALFTQENSPTISRVLRWSAATFILGVGISAATAGLIVAGPLIAALLVAIFVILATVILIRLGIRQSYQVVQQAQDLADSAIIPTTGQPTITTVSPPADTTVPPQTQPTATFNKDINPASLTNQSFQLRDPAGNLVPGEVVYNHTLKQATYQPENPLGAGTYTATITTDVRDLTDVALNAAHTWRFTVV